MGRAWWVSVEMVLVELGYQVGHGAQRWSNEVVQVMVELGRWIPGSVVALVDLTARPRRSIEGEIAKHGGVG